MVWVQENNQDWFLMKLSSSSMTKTRKQQIKKNKERE